MQLKIRAHFDGHVFVPDEPVSLPKDRAVSLTLSIDQPTESSLAERLAALDELASQPVRNAHISDESLRREQIYEDR